MFGGSVETVQRTPEKSDADLFCLLFMPDMMTFRKYI